MRKINKKNKSLILPRATAFITIEEAFLTEKQILLFYFYLD